MKAIGIDLGTTNSLITVWRDGAVEPIPNALGEFLTPSAISIDDGGAVVVGRPARDRLVSHPDRTVASFKRWMGTARETRLARGHVYRPEELSALVLMALKADAEAHLGHPVEAAVISVPAYFNDIQRKATLDAGRLAGLHVERLVNEPTAAALAYGLNEVKEGNFLVFDLGGGTFDVSVLDKYEGVMEVRATSGDPFLGGDDFTSAIAGLAVERLRIDRDALTPVDRARIERAAETTKRELTREREAEMHFVAGDAKHVLAITREDFEAVSTNLLARLRQPLARAISDARLDIGEIDQVILVGGATRMPAIRSLVARLMGRMPLSHIDPDTTVARGAGVQAALKARDAALEDVVMTDVTPFTLGVEAQDSGSGYRGSIIVPIIERNSIVPISRSEIFSTIEDNQERVEVPIYQGENLRPSENVRLGALSIALPKAPRGEEGIEVRFTYDINGALEVEVTSLSTKKTVSAIFRNESGLDEEELKKRFAALASIKTPPRERAENAALIARAERIYAEALGEERDRVRRLLGRFIAEIEAPQQGDEAAVRERFKATLDDLERGSILLD